MGRNKALGFAGEEAAAAALVRKGYEIVGRNVHVGRLEIDLIAWNEERFVFAEVKTRKTYPNPMDAARPADAVDARKRERLVSAAEVYLRDHADLIAGRSPGIDVIEVYADPADAGFRVLEIRHHENAVR